MSDPHVNGETERSQVSPHSNLKANALSGAKWNLIGHAGRQVMAFLVSIVLARLLTPREFGLLAVLVIFQEIANALVNSGLNAPLVQEKEISPLDCSTVFYFNVVVAAACYLMLVAAAPQIASFYREPELRSLILSYGLVFLIYAVGNIQLGLLLRELRYRQLNTIDLIGVASSGAVAIFMALRGYGAYSLVGQQLSHAIITSFLYWLNSSWRPTLAFSVASFQRFFRFGSRVLVVSILDKALNTLDNLLIGRIEGAAFAGQYSRGKNTRELPISVLTGVIASLVFPLFSRISNPTELRDAHARFVGFVTYLSAPAMVGMALVAEPLITVIYSAKWLPAVPFLQLFCLFGITVPFNSILVQTIMSRGEGNGLLSIELRKKAVLVVALGVGAFLGPMGLVWALCAGHYVMLFMSMRFVARLLDASVRSILAAALPGVGLSALMALPVYVVGRVPWATPHLELLVSLGTGLASYWALSAVLGSRDYLFAKGLVLSRLRSPQAGYGV